MKLSKNQKLLALSAIVVAVAFLLFSCETGVKTEVKTDSTLQDTTLVDTLKVDTLK
jgi:hypothetical protein